MNLPYQKNGLVLKYINSKVIALDEVGLFNNIDELHKFIIEKTGFKSAYAVFYTYDEVLFGEITEKTIELYKSDSLISKEIIKMRVFNEKAELYMWKSKNRMKGRLRTDEEGKETLVVEAEQVVIGTKSEKIQDGFVKLSEERGIKVILPEKIVAGKTIDDGTNRLKIMSRNYVEFNDDSIATYKDCRLIGFTTGNNKNEEVK